MIEFLFNLNRNNVEEKVGTQSKLKTSNELHRDDEDEDSQKAKTDSTSGTEVKVENDDKKELVEYDSDVEKMADNGEVRGASGSFDPISRPAPRALRDRREEVTSKNLNIRLSQADDY